MMSGVFASLLACSKKSNEDTIGSVISAWTIVEEKTNKTEIAIIIK